MAFVANARPEQSDTHACSLNKGIGWESRTWKESAAPRNLWIWDWTDAGRILKIAVFLKHCFRAKKICARWKPVIGGAVMALREGWSNAFVRGEILCTWMDKSEDLQTTETKETCAKKRGSFRHIRHTKAMVRQSSFFYLQKHSFHPLWAVSSGDIALGTESIYTKAGMARWRNENSKRE